MKLAIPEFNGLLNNSSDVEVTNASAAKTVRTRRGEKCHEMDATQQKEFAQ
jgi:hypothetical protein